MTAAPTAVRGSRSARLQPAIWVLLTIALALAAPRLPWKDTLTAVADSKLLWVLSALLANWLVLPLWSLEWLLLLPQRGAITFGRMFSIVAITAATLNTIPFFVGEATGFALLVGAAELTPGAAASMIAMDQLLVGVGKVLTLAATAAIAPLPPWLRLGVSSFVGVVVALAAGLIVLAHRWSAIHRYLTAAPSQTRALLARLVGQGAHLSALRHQQRLVPLLALSAAKKLAELAAILAVQQALGVAFSPASGLLVLAGLSITTVIPVAPGNLGVYEATVFACYRSAGVEASQALALALVQHLCFLLPPIVTGYSTLSVGRLRRR